MTPTFAAGLGVVIAIGMASGAVPHVLRYAPDDIQPCAVKGCRPPGKGRLASAKPGQRLVRPAHSPAGKAAPDAPAPPAPHSGGQGQVPAVWYQTVSEDGNGDFQGEITLAGPSGLGLPSHWRFRFTYPSGQIVSVWASGSVQRSKHAATVYGGRYPEGGSWGQGAQIGFTVYGHPGPPTGCRFGGQPCQYQNSPTGSNGGSSDGGSSYGGGSYSGSSYGGGGYGY